MPLHIHTTTAPNSHTHNHQHEPMNQPVDHAAHNAHAHHTDKPASKMDHGAHGGHDAHAGHGVMHEGHTTMMRNRFSGHAAADDYRAAVFTDDSDSGSAFHMPTFPGSELIAPVLGTIIFFYGGLPFLGMARQELALRQPGMMTLISLAITTAYLYSLGIFFFPPPMRWECDRMHDGFLLGTGDPDHASCCSVTGLNCAVWGRRRARCANWRNCCPIPPNAFCHPAKPKPLQSASFGQEIAY